MRYTKEQAIDSILHKDGSCPQEVIEALELLDVKFFNFDGKVCDGQIVVNKAATQDAKKLFEFMFELKFPLQEVSPIVKYDWNDEASMSANNSSGFNYRKIAGQDIMSLHSQGLAIDLNPKINPWVKGASTQPANGSYSPNELGTLFNGHPVVEFMKDLGWEWGGEWKDEKGYQDYQHFQKII